MHPHAEGGRGRREDHEGRERQRGGRRLAAGGTFLDPEVVASLMTRQRQGPVDRLTPRERGVLALMAEGRSRAALAAQRFVSEGAVARHTKNICTELDLAIAPDVHRRVPAVLARLTA